MKPATPLILPTTQSETPAGVIDFGLGHPAAELLLVASARHVKSYQQESVRYEAALLNFLQKVELAH